MSYKCEVTSAEHVTKAAAGWKFCSTHLLQKFNTLKGVYEVFLYPKRDLNTVEYLLGL
jgi:hypothetical protein